MEATNAAAQARTVASVLSMFSLSTSARNDRSCHSLKCLPVGAEIAITRVLRSAAVGRAEASSSRAGARLASAQVRPLSEVAFESVEREFQDARL